MEEINWLMEYVRFDAGIGYRGYLPFVITVNDMMNYGECSGRHVCGANEPCVDHNTAGQHVKPEVGMTTVILDSSIGAESRCQQTECEPCFVHSCVCVCVCIYIYIYIYASRSVYWRGEQMPAD